MPSYASEETKNALTEIIVTAIRITNEDPAGTYPSLASNLRYNPIVELQSRGLPEGQSDVTTRGGLFENTGFKIGAATIIDPQTGHYSIDLPISSSASSYLPCPCLVRKHVLTSDKIAYIIPFVIQITAPSTTTNSFYSYYSPCCHRYYSFHIQLPLGLLRNMLYEQFFEHHRFIYIIIFILISG